VELKPAVFAVLPHPKEHLQICGALPNPHLEDPYWAELLGAIDVGAERIDTFKVYSPRFQGDDCCNPFSCLNVITELRESDPVVHIQWLMDNAKSLALYANSEEDEGFDEELYIEQEIYSYVEGIINRDAMTHHERLAHCSDM